MTSITKEKIYTKLEKLNEYIGYLEQLSKEIKSEKEFIKDFHLFGLVERYLQLSIQILIDSSHLIVIDLGLSRPEDNYEVISILHNKDIINEKSADALSGMIGLRNILVHEYGKVDKKKVYKVLTSQLNDLTGIKKQIINYLK